MILAFIGGVAFGQLTMFLVLCFMRNRKTPAAVVQLVSRVRT